MISRIKLYILPKMQREEVYHTTADGLKKLKEELKKREQVLRVDIANTLNEMRNQGDLRENDGYSMAVENQQINESRITEIKQKIKIARVVKDNNKSVVGLGDIVTLKGEKDLRYEIVSEEEANPLEGKISHASPIGLAIIGKKINTAVKITTPRGILEYLIAKID